MSNNVVAQFYAEWEREELARNEQSERLKALFAAAKDRDLKPKALRVAFKARFAMLHGSPEEQDKRVAHDEAVEEYLNDLAGVRARAREIIEEFPSDHDPETGEVIEHSSFPATSPVVTPSAGTGGDADRQTIPEPEAAVRTPAVPLRTEAAPREDAVSAASVPSKRHDDAAHVVDGFPTPSQPAAGDDAQSVPEHGSSGQSDGETEDLGKGGLADTGGDDGQRTLTTEVGEEQASANASPAPRQWTHADPAHPDCLNPSQCGGFSNFARCDACKAAAANMQEA